jgi:hypothetical protein
MISLKTLDVKSFMAKLLTAALFDEFVLKEMEIQTYTCFSVSGQLNEDFFSQEELEKRKTEGAILWNEIKNIAYSIIKGNKTPLSMKIVFQLPEEQKREMVESLGDNLRSEDVGGLFLNIRFEKNELHIITGAAIKTFTLDKTLEREWDAWVKDFLKKQGFVFEEE